LIYLDGAMGEGGGQVLRSALTLSALTGQPLHMERIRAHRPKAGLMPQHLQAVRAAAAVCGARVAGAALHAQTLVFEPGALRPGTYHFDVGTAGAVSLVLQTIFLPLAFAGGLSNVALIGGTHIPLSPSFHYLQFHWLHYIRQAGYLATLELEQAGFYPQGGGQMHAHIEPATAVRPLTLTTRGALVDITVFSAVANLDLHIAERQREQARRGLVELGVPVLDTAVRIPARSPGSVLLVLARFESAQVCYGALGARGKPAERVADEAVSALRRFLKTGAAIDAYLADQLLLPLAFAPGRSAFHTAEITQHLATNAEVIKAFVPVAIDIQGKTGQPGRVLIDGVAPGRCGSRARL
jgi:RNA 3'-terminal phosphate cyclase (ATP)